MNATRPFVTALRTHLRTNRLPDNASFQIDGPVAKWRAFVWLLNEAQPHDWSFLANARACFCAIPELHHDFSTMVEFFLSLCCKLFCNKEITIETKEEFSLLAEFGEFSEPCVCLFLGKAFASNSKRRHDI
jgi:hypothetical protein